MRLPTITFYSSKGGIDTDNNDARYIARLTRKGPKLERERERERERELELELENFIFQGL